MSKVHDLINQERKKRGIYTVYWSREMARLAQSQANYCAKIGRLVHSDRFAFQGGENLAEGGGNFPPGAIVGCWLNSKAGHREYLLSPMVKKAGIGIAKSRGKTFVAWAFSDKPPSYPDCPYYKPPRPKKEGFPLKMKFQRTQKFNQLQKVITKLFLNLLVLAGLGFLVRHSYLLFTQPTAPLKNSIILLIGIITWIFLIKLLRKKYRWTKPSFKLTTFSVVAILLIFAFAGVQPMSSYKDNVISKWNTYWTEQKVKTEENLAKAQIEEQKRIEEQRIEEQKKVAEQVAKEAQIQTELNQNYSQLFNEFRTENGKLPLTFDPKLNELARQRAIEISQPGNFGHEGIKKYNLGENIAMMAYSTDSNTSLIELWANSSGHRSNMLSSTYTRTGFARVGRYAVQIFD